MSELNRLLRQAHRIMGGNSPRTSRSEEDAKMLTGAGVPDASRVTALTTDDDVKPKAASRKKADQSPNVPGDFATESHKGDPIYETAMNPKIGSKNKKADFPPAEEAEVAPVETEPAGEMFGGEEEEEPCEDGSCTNADVVEALADLSEGLEDAIVEAGESPAAELLEAIQDVIDAVSTIQDAVSEDAMSDPAAKEAFKTGAAFKQFFVQQRNLKAAKVIRQKLAAHEASMKQKAPEKAPMKKAFDPKVLKNK